MHALVVGADGFAGRWLLRHLAEMGDTADALVGPRFQPPLPEAATFRQVDVRDEVAVRQFVGERRPDAIYYLAGISQRGEREVWASAVGVSLTGSVNVMLAAAAMPTAPRILYVSTGMVYQASAKPIDETGVTDPHGAYANAKLVSEQTLCQLGRSAGVDVIVVRPFNHTGPGQSEAFVVPMMAGQVATIVRGESDPVIQLSGPDSVRDFSDVRDVVRAYRLLVSQAGAGELFNVASGSGRSISSLARLLCELAGITVRIDVMEANEHDGQPVSLIGDAGKMRGLGWAPERSIDQTLADVLAEHLAA